MVQLWNICKSSDPLWKIAKVNVDVALIMNLVYLKPLLGV